MPARRSARTLTITLTLVVTLVVLTFAVTGSARAEEAHAFTPGETAGARLFYQGNIPIAVFSGSPDDIGRQQGVLVAEAASQLVMLPKQLTAEAGAEPMWPLMIGAAQLLMHNAPAAHHRELDAFVAASKLDAGAVAVGNTLLELRRMGCSVLIVEPQHSATGGPLFGRNFDFPTMGLLDRYSLVAVYRPEGRRAFASVAFPGSIGVFSGMNDAGLAVATLDVYESADGSSAFEPTGTPLAFVFRRILEECTTVAEAEQLLRSERPTTWMNLAVCDRDSSAVFEITPTHIGRRDPDDGVLPCTNHFRTSGLAVEEHCWRYPKLAAAAQAPSLTVDDVRSYLHEANQGELTLQTMVFEPRTLTLHLAIGTPPTSDDPLTAIELKPLFGGSNEVQ